MFIDANFSVLYYNNAISNNNNNNSKNDDGLLTVHGYIISAVILFFIGFFGFFLNLCVIIFMWRNKQLWTPLNTILFNLVCSDFLVSILGSPWTFLAAIYRTWIFGKLMCSLYGFIMSLLGITSITTLTVLAFERYLIISKPFQNHYLNPNSSIYIIVGIWCYALALTIPPLIGWGKYVNESANISCSVNWEEKSWNATSYIIYLFIFGLFIPLSVIIYSYTNILTAMRKKVFRMGRVMKAETQVTKMVLIMIIAFLIAWSPYAILALIVQFGDASIVTPTISVIPALLAKSSICYNPIIYVGRNTQFRQFWNQKTNHHVHEEISCETYDIGTSKNNSQLKNKTETFGIIKPTEDNTNIV